MIISFSGLDGAGKTTQIQLLLKKYEQIGAKTGSVYDYFPDIRYHNTTDLKRLYQELCNFDVIHMRYRLNSDMNSIIMKKLEYSILPQHVLSILAAFQGYLDHYQLYKHVLLPLLNSNKILIFDRYYYDELAFKNIYGCPDFILKILYSYAQNADLGFYIRIPVEECLNRNIHRPDSKVTIYQNKKNVELLTQQFDNIALNKQLITLNGMHSPQELSESVYERVLSLYQKNLYSYLNNR